MANLVRISTEAPQPFMVPPAAKRFEKLRKIVHENCGVDFLAKCGDVLRDPDFVSTKDGVANRSWHKTGRTFDYDQTSNALLVVSEPKGSKQFFRTWLICQPQNGKLGVMKTIHDYRGFFKSGYVFDFTAAAENIGFRRIPAWSGWEHHYNRREFWHYQFDEGMTWAAAMTYLKNGSLAPANVDRPATSDLIGLNDRGLKVTQIQTALSKLGHLPAGEIDGVFGAKTRNAVAAFQRSKGLDADGLVGPKTRAALGI